MGLNVILAICGAANEIVARGYHRYDRWNPRVHEIAVRNVATRLATEERLGVLRVANDDGGPRATATIAGGLALVGAVEGTTAQRRPLTEAVAGGGRRFWADELGLVTT